MPTGVTYTECGFGTPETDGLKGKSLLRLNCGVWSLKQSGMAASYGVTAPLSRSFSPTRQRSSLLAPICWALLYATLLREETRNATTEETLCIGNWLSDAPRDVVS